MLSAGLRSGRYRKSFTTEPEAGLTEAGIYRGASETAFMMTADSRLASPNETQARRHAGLGNPYAQYALAQLLRERNRPWPASPPAYSAVDTEHTQESLSLLEAAAEAGVPEAIKAVAELFFHGHYDVIEPRPSPSSPYRNAAQKWVRIIQAPKDGKTLTQERLTQAPLVIRRDKAKAALLFQSAFDRDHDDDAGYYLGLIHATGALSSFDPKRQDIEFPAIASDSIKAEAFFHVVMRGKANDASLSNRAETEIVKLRLSPEDREEARRLADKIIAGRPRR
jgi:TPR repeat protein